MTVGEGPEAVERIVPVSRETRERLMVYAGLIRRWQPAQNLVSPQTLDALWTRHIADCAQLVALFPQDLRWVDLGTGAGLPGMVTAILLAGRPGATVHLVESNQRKCAFLRTVIRETGAPAVVVEGRIDSVLQRFDAPVDRISARALAALGPLLELSAPLLARGIPAAFHKGADFATELAEASQSWTIDLVEHRSKIDPRGLLVEIRRAVRRDV